MGVRLDHGEDTLAEMHEINVTPFIDVMLVLLIIFMVAAPLATVDLGVDLPASAVAPQPRPEQPVFVTVKPDLSIAVGEDVIVRDALTATLDTATKGQKDERIYLRADKGTTWDPMAQVISALSEAKLQVSVVTQPEDEAAKRH